MLYFLDIETTSHIDIPDDGYMRKWIDKKNIDKRTGKPKKNLFNYFLDKNTAVPSLLGLQQYDELKNELHEPFIVESPNNIAREFASIIRSFSLIVTYNGDSFDLPILARHLIRFTPTEERIKGRLNLSNVLKGNYSESMDLMKILCGYKMDEMKPMRFVAESFGIKIDPESEDLWKELEEKGTVDTDLLKNKLYDDLRILRELYFKITGITPKEV